MLSLIRFFFLLCLLRTRPQDLPASQALLVLVAAANILIATVLVWNRLGEPFTGLLAGLLDTAILSGFIALLLRFRGSLGRFLQAATAALGASAVISAISFPVEVAVSSGVEAGGTSAQLIAVVFLLFVWLQVALGHVFRHALDVSMPLGVGLAFAYSVASATMTQHLLMPPVGP
jgi:hypothetical protein